MPHPFTENASLNPKKGEIDMDDSNIHIVKRTDQWKERAVQSYIVPRGVLCVELTPDGNTRIKIGEGNKYYSQLPYIGANIDISKYFTKEEVKKLVEDTSEATVIAYMDKQPYVRVLGPILPSASALPKTGNKDGDIRFVKMAKVSPDGKAYIEYIWFNNRWDPLSSALDIDVSKFATKEELAVVAKAANDLAKRVTLLEQAKHIHPNKSILDSITAPFTTELAAKLSGIEPNANKYVLPVSTRHSLGGIIIGEGLLIDAAGRVSVDTSGIIVPPYDDTEVKRRITNLENVSHTHINKSILDATTASYTTAEKTKLAGLENYTLPVASANTLGGIKVGANLSIDQDGVLSATGGEGSGGVGNLTDGIATTVSSANVDTDMYTNVQWEQGSIAQNGDLPRNDRIRTHDYFPIKIPSDGKITLIAHDTNDVELTWNIMLYTTDRQLLLDSPWMPCGSELNLIEYINTGKLARYVLCYPDNDPIEPSNLKDAVLRMTNTAIDVNYSSGLMVNQDNELEVSPATTTDIGGVKVGDGLSITSDGTLSVDAGIEYVAGDGISIDEGSSTTDITSLTWEQGSINPVNGTPDDFTTTVIRSPMIEVGLTSMLNVSAQATDNSDMLWKAAFYDSNDSFISMTSAWTTLSDGVTRPANATHVIIVLRKDAETEIDENALLSCEISWPIEVGKYVITNTGVTHAELESSSVIITENGETKPLLTFGQDLDVTNGVVSIPDYHRLVLNVEE